MAEFKKSKSKNFRKRRTSSDSEEESEEESDFRTKLEDIKELQKLREKPHGVSVVGLALGKNVTKTEEIVENDPFKMKTGGIVDMKALKSTSKPLVGDDGEAIQIGTTFAAETNRRDEDAEMLRYVEEELAKTKGHLTATEDVERNPTEDDFLYELPENLKSGPVTKRSEDMLSNQMLSGIPEVDLGIDAKIKNIEMTEEAKQKLIQDRMRKRDEVSVFVPTNMAVNFVQHNRFNIEDSTPLLKKKEEAPKPKPLRVGDAGPVGGIAGGKRGSKAEEKATDDFYYEKFKKQMRRY